MISGYVAKIRIANDDVTLIDDVELDLISFEKGDEVIQNLKQPLQVTIPIMKLSNSRRKKDEHNKH